MEELKDTEGSSFGESSQAVPFSSSPECPSSSPSPPTFAEDEKTVTDQNSAIPADLSNESGVHNISELALSNKSKEGMDNVVHQLEDGSSDIIADVKVDNNSVASDELNHRPFDVGDTQNKTQERDYSSEHLKQAILSRGLVDTAAPFESVKEAVSKFGGIVDWKAHKAQSLERRNQVQRELVKVHEEIPHYKKQSEAAEDAKSHVLKELDGTKRLIEELKLSLDRAQTEEVQAKQDSELAQLRLKELEQGIADESSIAAKTQLEVARSRHEAAVEELRSVKEELNALRGEYASLVQERDTVIKRAEEAASASKVVEKEAEDLTIELITAKESLESAHAAHLEAEEHRIGATLAREQDCLNWAKELKQAEEEVQQLDVQLLLTKDLQSKLDTASALLLSLKVELAAHMESKLNQESDSIDKEKPADDSASAKKELEELKSNIEKAKDEGNCLRAAAASLQSELEREKTALTTMRQREGMASIAVSSLEAEIIRTKQELELVLTKEREARKKTAELPKLLHRAAQEADRSKSAAASAREELKKAKEEAEQSKASASTTETRLRAALKEIEAAKASERLAVEAIRALQESEQAASIEGAVEDSPCGVTLPLEEYYALSKRAHEAEALANERVSASVVEIEVAKEIELKSLERLEEAYREMNGMKEALRVATERAERAKEGKLGAEQELRTWRAEHEQRRRRASDQAVPAPSRSPPRSVEEKSERKSFEKGYKNPENPNPGHEVKKMRKKLFFPRIVMFLARKKAQSLK